MKRWGRGSDHAAPSLFAALSAKQNSGPSRRGLRLQSRISAHGRVASSIRSVGPILTGGRQRKSGIACRAARGSLAGKRGQQEIPAITARSDAAGMRRTGVMSGDARSCVGFGVEPVPSAAPLDRSPHTLRSNGSHFSRNTMENAPNAALRTTSSAITSSRYRGTARTGSKTSSHFAAPVTAERVTS